MGALTSRLSRQALPSKHLRQHLAPAEDSHMEDAGEDDEGEPAAGSLETALRCAWVEGLGGGFNSGS